MKDKNNTDFEKWLRKIEQQHEALEKKLDEVVEKIRFKGVPVGEVKDKSDIDLIWDDIEKNFEWERLWNAMDVVGWEWVSAENGVPTIAELKKEAKRLVYTAYEKKTFYGSGGFEAEYSEGYGTVALQFVFGQWEGGSDE